MTTEPTSEPTAPHPDPGPNEIGTSDTEGSGGMDTGRVKVILEAALLAAGRPLALNDLEQLFADDLDAPPRNVIRAALAELDQDWQGRCLALQEVASGFRAQVRDEFEPRLARLWDEKPPRYSRALLETLAIIAYRQPITRSEIEDIRGVSVSTQIVRTLTEREWARVVGHRDAPGRPAMYGTTRQFLDHFNLKSLDQLPELSELDQLGHHPELEFDQEPAAQAGAEGEAEQAVVAVTVASADLDGEGGDEPAGDAMAHAGDGDRLDSTAVEDAAGSDDADAAEPMERDPVADADADAEAGGEPAAEEDSSCSSAW